MNKQINFRFLVSVFLGISVLFSSCLKKFGEEQEAREKETLKEYISDNDITVPPTSSGMYYLETLEGTGLAPETGDSLWVHFTGEYLDEFVFQSTSEGPPFIFQIGVGEVLDGFDEGVSYMKRGGEATLIVPSWLAYGANGYYTIPGYTTLVYKVQLVDDAGFDNAEDLAAFLDANQIDTQPTESGLYCIETLAGTGEEPLPLSSVSVHYTGMLLDSTIFDTSIGGSPISFTLGAGAVIPGWDEGIALMKKGGKATLIIPHTLGYGVIGSGTVIPPKAYLVFDVELLDL